MLKHTLRVGLVTVLRLFYMTGHFYDIDIIQTFSLLCFCFILVSFIEFLVFLFGFYIVQIEYSG